MTDKTIKAIFEQIPDMGRSWKIYDISNSNHEAFFYGSIDRFSIIAHALHDRRRILDIGPGNGLLLSILHELGHDCYAVDWKDRYVDDNWKVYLEKRIKFDICYVEVDPLPFGDDFFDAVTCCQVLEPFTHSHLHAVREMRRVLKSGGLVEIDAPNAVDLRNRLRMIRGKHITWDYEKEYLYKEPILYKNRSFFDRHNREFTKGELEILLKAGDFREIKVNFLKSRRYRPGIGKLKSMGSAMRDIVPSFRKSIIGFGIK
jgi:SAM-dependent methyltransferase